MSSDPGFHKTFLRLPRRVPAMLYEPDPMHSLPHVGVVVMHSDMDYLDFTPGPELARRGFVALTANTVTRGVGTTLDDRIQDVRGAVEFLRSVPGIDTVVLLGHSGGATLMTAYQAVAENGTAVFQGLERNIAMSDSCSGMIPADAVMLLDANYGNGAMTLLSLDPAITDENDATRREPLLDVFQPANGYDPSGSHYTEAFAQCFQAAQGARMNRLIDYARDRLALLERGKGFFAGDEIMVIPGGAQIKPCNKLFPQDTRFLSHTRRKHTLLHADGSMTDEIIRCLRPAEPGIPVDSTVDGALVTTVRAFLSSSSVHVFPEYGYNEDSLFGIDWSSSYCCGPSNISLIHVPKLLMGMTGSYEYLAAEILEDEVTDKNITVAFTEAASHDFATVQSIETCPGQYGDTTQVTFDYVQSWLFNAFG